MNSSAQTFYARTFAMITFAVLAYLLYEILRPFFAPIAWASFLAFLLHPAHARLQRKIGPGFSAALLTVAALLLLLGPLAALGAAFVTQAAELMKYIQGLATEYKPAAPSDLGSVPVLGPALLWLQEATGISLAQIHRWAAEAARAVLRPLATFGQRAVLGALGTVIGFVLMIFILFFAVRDGKAIFTALRDLIPASATERARLFDHLGSVTRAMVFGSGVTALVQGTLVGIGFAVASLPSPIVFGVLAALFALVPMAGTPVVWGPAVIVLALDQRWGMALFLALWGVFVITIDNVLRPLLVSGRADVGTLTVFVGVLGGVWAFGPIGVILGPLVLALAIALVRFTLELRQTQNDSPILSAIDDRGHTP